MKLIYAGPSNPSTLDFSNYLFNCLRNPACQRKYFVPIKSLSDLTFYVDLPGVPDTYHAALVDMCDIVCDDDGGGDFNDDFNDDFDIGSSNCHYNEISVTWNNYVVGKKPGGGWYGVFGGIGYGIEGRLNLGCFFLRFTFTIAGTEYVYYSEQICIEKCDPLLFIRGCYPNEPIGAKAFDCNGIYYGFPIDNNYLGQANFRYFHTAYVRFGSVFGYKHKLSFSFFNSKATYKTIQERQKLLEFELVPEFYKDHLAGIMARGNVEIAGKQYTLDSEQNWQVGDSDSKLWQLDTVLNEQCKLYFGCGVSDCTVPLPQVICEDAPVGFDFIFTDVPAWLFTFNGGTFAVGDTLDWELYDVETNTLLDSGNISSPVWEFSWMGSGFDPTKKCYKLRWRKHCVNDAFSYWQEGNFGLCDQGPGGGGGTVECLSYSIQGGFGGGTIEWEDCATGTPLSQYLGQGAQINICSRIAPTGNYELVQDPVPC